VPRKVRCPICKEVLDHVSNDRDLYMGWFNKNCSMTLDGYAKCKTSRFDIRGPNGIYIGNATIEKSVIHWGK